MTLFPSADLGCHRERSALRSKAGRNCFREPNPDFQVQDPLASQKLGWTELQQWLLKHLTERATWYVKRQVLAKHNGNTFMKTEKDKKNLFTGGVFLSGCECWRYDRTAAHTARAEQVYTTPEDKTSRGKEVRGDTTEAFLGLTYSKIPQTHSQLIFWETPLGTRKEKPLTKLTEVL